MVIEKQFIIRKWLELARHFPIIRRLPFIGAGKPTTEKTNEKTIDRTGGA